MHPAVSDVSVVDEVLRLYDHSADKLREGRELHEQTMQLLADPTLAFEDKVESIHAPGGLHDQTKAALRTSHAVFDFLGKRLGEHAQLFWDLHRGIRFEDYAKCARARDAIARIELPELGELPENW